MLGLNVLEEESTVELCLNEIIRIMQQLPIQVLFKASFDKANRSSYRSARGPGLEGLARLQFIRNHYQLPILTDVHTESQVSRVAEVADLIQIPAFLCRQTDLIQAVAETQKPIHIKKMQMLAPFEMQAIIEKCVHFGNQQVILCERGSSFGQGQLIVDPLSFPQLKALQVPVSFDVTHSLQLPGRGLDKNGRFCADGRAQYTRSLAFAGVSQGISSVFIECHPEPNRAWCDGACALPLVELHDLIKRLSELDTFIKAQTDSHFKSASSF